MTIKLPIILSAMIAALAVPGSLASQAGTEAAKPAEEAAPAAMEAKEAGGEGVEAKEADKKKRKHHSEKHHAKHKRHKGNGGQGHTPDKWDEAYDQVDKGQVNKGNGDSSGCAGDSAPADHGKELPPEVPGQKGPNVPRGE